MAIINPQEIETLAGTLRKLGIKSFKTPEIELQLTDQVPLTPEQVESQKAEFEKAMNELDADLNEVAIMFYSSGIMPAHLAGTQKMPKGDNWAPESAPKEA
jgi:hypothetical protein